MVFFVVDPSTGDLVIPGQRHAGTLRSHPATQPTFETRPSASRPRGRFACTGSWAPLGGSPSVSAGHPRLSRDRHPHGRLSRPDPAHLIYGRAPRPLELVAVGVPQTRR